ncbi:MAG: membrane AbrB-like protein [bacterium]|jgi:membrane AbrB-like protein
MPFLIGGVVGSSLFVGGYEKFGKRLPKVSPLLRLVGVATIGAMIGVTVPPDLLVVLPSFWISALALIPFILLAHAGSYALMRFVGKYGAVDAYFASLPGGLVEAVLIGEKAGADVRVLTVQHFVRILCVVISVPLLFYVMTGEVVGSSAGEVIDTTAYGMSDILLILLLAGLGSWVGQLLKLPAAHLLGPLAIAVIVSVSGLAEIHVPSWLLHLAQFIIGATLGAQFSGISGPLLRRAMGMGILAVGYMLGLGFLFAKLLEPHVPVDVSAVFICFAAGGFAEMSLIALSLDLSPVIVALHHLIRIILTLFVGKKAFSILFKPSVKQ